MKKIIIGILMMICLLGFQNITAYDGTCGTNVAYTINGNTINFQAVSGSAVYDTSCTDIFRDNKNISTVKIINRIAVEQAGDLFMNCKNVKEMDLANLDVSNVYSTTQMFIGCSSLVNLNVTNWKTSNVYAMVGMFAGCYQLKQLDLSTWDTSRLGYIQRMFDACSGLTNLNLSNWNTSNLVAMDTMFRNCSSLTTLNLVNWDTSKVTNFESVFYNCSALKTLTLGKNTLKTNIFTTLPAYKDTWYYVAQGTDAGKPLALKTAKKNGELFTGYTYNTMAGTWSTDKNNKPPEEVTISMKLYKGRSASDSGMINSLEYNDGNLLPSDIYSSDEFTLSVTGKNCEKTKLVETINLPDGLSFSPNKYERSTKISIGGNGKSTVTIDLQVYSVYCDQYLNPLTITASGDKNAELNIPVNQGEGVVKIDIRNNRYQNPVLIFFDRLLKLNWAKIPSGKFADDEAMMAMRLAGAAYNDQNMLESLHNLGFTKIFRYSSEESDWALIETNPFTCTHYIAQKKITVGNEIKTVVVVAVRGTHGRGQWIGDFLSAMAIDGTPSTFWTSAEEIYDYLERYVKNNGIAKNDAIVFVCGHSRGAAAAGIVGHKINEDKQWYKSVTYTFATPNNISLLAMQADKNIFNYMDAHDIVGYVPQGFVKYGNTYVVGAVERPESVTSEYLGITGWNASGAPDNSVFVELIVKIAQDANTLLTSKDAQTDYEIEKIWADFCEKLATVADAHLAYHHATENYIAWLAGNSITDAKPYKDNTNPIENEKTRMVREIFKKLANTNNEMNRVRQIKLITKLILQIIQHDVDFLYTTISCPVDVKLYNSAGAVVASIVDHQIEFITESDDYFVTTDGKTDYVFYKRTYGYSLKIVGNDEGEMAVETHIIGDGYLGSKFEIKDSYSFPAVSVKTNQKYNLNIVDYDLDNSTLTSDGFEDPGSGTKVIIIDKDLLTRTIDLGTRGESSEKLTYQLGAVVRPSGKSQKVAWSSSNTSVATIDSTGLVRAKKAGTVTITAKALDGSNASASVTLNVVINVQRGNILIKGMPSVGVGQTITLEAKIDQDVKPTDQSLIWESMNPEIARISSDGAVSGVKVGTTRLKVCPAGSEGYCTSFDLEVTDSTYGVNILNDDAMQITGQTVVVHDKFCQLHALPEPLSASHNFNWTSHKTSVATVNEAGGVTFKKAGSVQITANATDGSGKSAKVTMVYVPKLEIKDSKIKGYNKGIKIVIPYEKNVSKYVVKEVYDVAAKKAVKPTVTITDSGKNTTIKLSGSGLVNGKVYRIKIYRTHTFSGKNYNSNTVTQYAAPNPTVNNLTVNPRSNSVVMTSNYKEKADGIQYRVYNGTTNKQVRTTVLSDMHKTGSIKELVNGELYFAVVRTYKAYNGKKLWTMDSNKAYFVPLSNPAGGKVTFSNSTTAVVSMKKDAAATGIRVLYRGADGKLVNGCEAKGTKCTVKNLKKTNAYEFYVMKFKTINGKKHYGPGVVLPYKMKASGLAAPSKVVVDMTNTNTTFTITKSSKAKGISVLYRVNEGKSFKLLCEKAAASCTKKLDTSKNYTFYIMQYKVTSGRKVYSPGVTVKNRTGAKDASGLMADYTVVNEAVDPALLYDALADYYTEEDLLRDEAYAVMAGIPKRPADVPEAGLNEAASAGTTGQELNDSRTADNEILTLTVTDDARTALLPLFEGHALPATGFSSLHRTVLLEQPKDLNYKPLQMHLQVPSLNVDTELVNVPLAEESWQVKWLDDRAGVLEGSAMPGKGYSVVAAHNTLNDTEYGPFALLGTLEEHDTIMITDRGGKMKLFRVYANELLLPDDTEKLAEIAGRAENSLVLVTCENEAADGGYLNRRVVFAKPAEVTE